MHVCKRCNTGFSRKDSLMRHTNRTNPCRLSNIDVAVFKQENLPKCGEKDDDSASVASFGTLNKVINKNREYPSLMKMKEIMRPDVNKKRLFEDNDRASSSSSSKRLRQDDDDDRPDIIDCVGYITPVEMG